MKWTFLSVVVACTGNDKEATEVTYYRDVAPIVERSCVSCHVDQGTGPFPLDSYDALYTVRDLARDQVSTRQMPPWFTSKECATYTADISLTDDEIALFEAWVDQGSPEGDPKDAIEDTAGDDDHGEGLDGVDVTLGMVEPYSPTEPDEVHCFNLAWPRQKATFITGIKIEIGNESIMHHITLHTISPDYAAAYTKLETEPRNRGYVCADSSGANDPGTVEIGGWTGGGKLTSYPDGSGSEILPGSLIQLQVHYTPKTNQLGTVSDLTTLKFSVDASAEQAYTEIVEDVAMTDMPVMLPKNDPDVFLQADIAPPEVPERFYLFGASFHMHYLGTGGGVWIKHPDGTEDCVIDLTGWNPDWQQGYVLSEPLLFEPGDMWHLECRWDNSQENQPVIDGEQRATRDIPWGVSLDDEMCRSSVKLVGAPK